MRGILLFLGGWVLACTAIYLSMRDVPKETEELASLERQLVSPVMWTEASDAGAEITNRTKCKTDDSNPCSKLSCVERQHLCSSLTNALSPPEKKSEKKEKDKEKESGAASEKSDESLTRILRNAAERPVLEHTFQTCCVGAPMTSKPPIENHVRAAWWDLGVPGITGATVVATMLSVIPFIVFAIDRRKAKVSAKQRDTGSCSSWFKSLFSKPKLPQVQRLNDRERDTKPPQRSNEENAREGRPKALTAPPNIVLVNAFLAMFGWFHVLVPYRGAAAVALGHLRQSWAARDFWLTYPWPDGPMPTLMAGFIGWYIHMTSVASNRVFREGFVGARIHGQFFSRALIVLGFSLALSSVSPTIAVPLAFLLGIFPFALPSLVTGVLESIGLKTKAADLSEGDVIALPGVSRLDARRLNEEGIETLAQLASADASKLNAALPTYGGLPEQWIDMAKAKMTAFWAIESTGKVTEKVSNEELLQLLQVLNKSANEAVPPPSKAAMDTMEAARTALATLIERLEKHQTALKATQAHDSSAGGASAHGSDASAPQGSHSQTDTKT